MPLILPEPVREELAKNPLQIVVVGPTNVGKTSLIRSLTRARDFGRVADTAGVTIEALPVRLSLGLHEPVVMKIYDTPGFQDVGDARRTLGFTPSVDDIVEYFKTLKNRHEVSIIETLRHCHVAAYVIKPSEEPTDDHHEQLFLIQRMGCPAIVVFHRYSNESRDYRPQWEQLLRSCALHNNTMTIDAHVFEPQHEENFYLLLRREVALGSPHDQVLQAVADLRRTAREEKLERAATRIGTFLDWLRTHRVVETGVEKERQKEANERAKTQLETDQRAERRRADADLLRIFDFNSACTISDDLDRDSGVNVSNRSWLGRRFGKHVAAGTGVGLALDLATLPLGMPGLFTIAGLAVGAFGGGAYNIAYDPSANRVDAAFSEKILPGEFERHLQLVQTLATSGVAAATEGLQDKPAAVKLGSFRLKDTPETKRRLEVDVTMKLPLTATARDAIRTMLAKPKL